MPIQKIASVDEEVGTLFPQLREATEKVKAILDDIAYYTDNEIDGYSEASVYSHYLHDRMIDVIEEMLSSTIEKAQELAFANREDDAFLEPEV